jgi:hypothetical protein
VEVFVVTNRVAGFLRTFLQNPFESARYGMKLQETREAKQFAAQVSPESAATDAAKSQANPLRDFFEKRAKGRGIWKWTHYFDVYHRHLAKFVGQEVHLAEIGIFSGGSLEMWRNYLGPRSRLTGVDIQPACKAYENEFTRIVIGDQGDREFWRSFLATSEPIDILIDDGGHHFHQQRTTLEEALPRLRPGGVFICEDVHGAGNPFTAYAAALADELNAYRSAPETGLQYASSASAFQRLIQSIHFYPYITVIERSEHAPVDFRCEKRGTEWQPFL